MFDRARRSAVGAELVLDLLEEAMLLLGGVGLSIRQQKSHYPSERAGSLTLLGSSTGIVTSFLLRSSGMIGEGLWWL